MKVDKETVLFSVLTGSRLYGTSTPKSDFDYKSVCLPALSDLLLNKKLTNRKEKPEGMKAGDKMIAGETETEYLPFQVFMDDFFNGQTYALEIVFAFRQGLALFNPSVDEHTKHQVELIMANLINMFLTRNVKKMVGYAVSQSKLYRLKTERYTSLTVILHTLNEFGKNHVHTNEDANLTLKDLPALVEKLVSLPHVKHSEILNQAGGTEMAPAVDIFGKQFALTNKIVTVVRSLEKTLTNYGERVKGFEGEGVDWKALSHALRITEQVLELSHDAFITFPRPNAVYLAAVKNGEKSLDEATESLNNAFAKIDDAVAASVLPERDHAMEVRFEKWKLDVLTKLYGLS